jgi:hypothetical protein
MSVQKHVSEFVGAARLYRGEPEWTMLIMPPRALSAESDSGMILKGMVMLT